MKPRLAFVDTLRGFALLIMFAYHFAFDLDHFGATRVDFSAAFWVAYRALILVLFLALSGVGVALADRPRPRARRVLLIAAGAAFISVVTYFLFPGEWVFFGVLHLLWAGSVIGPYVRGMAALAAGTLLTILPCAFRSPFFDGRFAQISGLGTQLPRTIDFVPLCPWLGVVFLGIFLGEKLPRDRHGWLGKGEPRLAALGRHSLLCYLAHQAILLPIAWLVARWV